MAKKKDKPQVINNIQELNLEIDYKELYQYIVEPSLYCYEYFPLILFILKKKYYNYFTSVL